jgi:hypothetical protein
MTVSFGSGVQQIGTYADPFVLSGTQISALLDNMTAWAARAHRQSLNAEQLAEWWLYRYSRLGASTGAWLLSPCQPIMSASTHVVLTQEYRRPATLGLSLLDPGGFLTPSNMESWWNYNGVNQFDPLLDEARKCLLRVGVRAYSNLAAGIAPTSSIGVTSGAIATLTDSNFVDWVNSPAAGTYASWFDAGSATPVTIEVDLGTVTNVLHAGIRFGTLVQTGGWNLPAAVQVRLSADGTHWTTYPQRPVGGVGVLGGIAPGDWDDGIILPGTATVANLLQYPGFETGFAAGFGNLPPAPWVSNSSSSFLCSSSTNDIVHSGLNGVSLDTPGVAQTVAIATGTLGPLAATVWACEEANSTFVGNLQIKIDLLSASNSVLHTLTSPVYALPNDGAFRQYTLSWPNVPNDTSVTKARVTLTAPTWTNKKPIIDDVSLYLLSSTHIPGVLESGATEIDFCDLNCPAARYVEFIVTPVAGTTWAVDELAVWGGTASGFIGRNLFTGYLGDDIQPTAEGIINLTATDTLKRLADNNDTTLTSRYGMVDLADICYALLTSTDDWIGAAGSYDAPWTVAELAWTSGIGLTGFVMPVWQGQSNNHLAYQYQLWHEIGWMLYADGNGVLTPFEPPYQQQRPDRVLIADPDGNVDVRFCRRTYSGKALRNVVEVRTGRSRVGAKGATTLQIPASVQRYGSRRNIITDPVMVTPDLQLKVAQQVLRDYGWNLNTLSCEIAPDFDTRPRSIHAFRASLRPQLYAKSSSVLGYRRGQEMWSLKSITQHIATGKWWGDADYIPYVAQSLDPPIVTQVTSSSSGSPYTFTLDWESYVNPILAGFNVYLSSTGPNGPYTLENSGGLISSGATSYAMPAVAATLDQQFYCYVTAVDVNGHESEPSQILAMLAGGSSVTTAAWEIVDLSVSFDQSQGPDAQGYVTYQCDLSFTSPPTPAPVPDNGSGGISSIAIYAGIGAPPANAFPPNPYWTHIQSWSGTRIPPGEAGTGQNPFVSPFAPGTLSLQSRFKPSNGSSGVVLSSGTRIYWLIANYSSAGAVFSNVAYTTVP